MTVRRSVISRPARGWPADKPLRVGIIGGGPGGIAMGVFLRKLGVDDFTIFEMSDGLGGTWHDNVYPGAAVDTPVPFYSFTFHPYDFTRIYTTRAELLDYLGNIADRFHLNEHFRFNTRVTKVVWDETAHEHELHTDAGEVHRFNVVVSAVGVLNVPKYPDWPGLDTFQGPKIHSARWDSSVELAGKRVAVVGTGSSAAQIVPAIAPDVAQLSVFQRQPGWLRAKGDRSFTAKERAQLATPLGRRYIWLKQRLAFEKSNRAFIEGRKGNAKAQAACEAYIDEVFQDRPDLAKMVTPDYPFGVKRVVKDDDFYPALLRDNVELVPHAVTEVTERTIIDESGYEREIDVLIMCTGFQPANFLATYEIVGRDGREIHDVWGPDAEAYLGLTVPGFPNFYMMYGPNTNGAPIMYMHERQAAFVAANLKRMVRSGVTAIEVRQSVMDRFNRILQKRLSRNVVDKYPEVHNYGRSATGRNVLGWGEGMTVYSILTRATPRLSSVARRLPPAG